MKKIPWWAYILLAILSYYSLTYIAPQLQLPNITLQNIARAAPGLAPLAAIVFLLLAAVKLYDSDEKDDSADD